jgi:predicted RNA methylase
VSAKKREIIIVVVKATAIYSFVVIDIAAGTGLYLTAKLLGAGVIIASVCSMAGVEGLKRGPALVRNIKGKER